MKSQDDPPLEQLLPIELRLLILEAELERLDSDARWLQQRRAEVLDEIESCNEALSERRRRSVLRRIK
ncbi:MAG: hypothetical protein JSU96_10100 [Acidobacteriota bacterium]|nr:MAG: hypothetical protein JSU96_10100 [Acidobacteriota bacterium]